MSLKIRALVESDYEDILVGWWKDWEFTPPLKSFLPDNATSGLMVMDGDEPVVAGFFYHTNSKIGWIDWIISSKSYRKNRKEAITLLLDSLTSAAKNMGYEFTYSLAKHDRLHKYFEDIGYTKSEFYKVELIKKL